MPFKNLIILVLFWLLVVTILSVLVNYYHGHTHAEAPVNQETAKTNATNIVAELVKRNKLEKSWASITASSVEKKLNKDYLEWEVVFVNDKITDLTKQKLYIFLTLDGEHIAINYSGN